jgi:class 3 adenylate cyclase
MVLVNAPIARDNPAVRGVHVAIDMQAAVQSLVVGWGAKGHAIGFGVGVAMGPAIVGTVGYEGRIDYTAIGNVVNLASRLCGSANDAQILVDPVVAQGVKDDIVLESLGVRPIKGYDHPLEIFVVARSDQQNFQEREANRAASADDDEVRAGAYQDTEATLGREVQTNTLPRRR